MDGITFDPELVRSLSRMIYGHETWLENVRKEGGKIVVDGMYGHHMVNDRAMPDVYSNIALFGDRGRIENGFELSVEDNCKRLRFDDTGDAVYTVYYDSNNVPWIKNDEGWAMGVKRDFSNVTYAAAYNLLAKKIVSRDGNPGSVVCAVLDIMPDTVRPAVGSKVKVQILYEGKPLPKAKVMVFRKGASEAEKYTADGQGRFEFPVEEAGTYMVIAKHADESKAVEDEYDEAVFESTLVIEAV